MSQPSRVHGILLAAGGSRRMGDPPKQLRLFAGEHLVLRAVRAARSSRLDQLTVVLGYAAAEVAEILAPTGVDTVLARDWSDGQSASVRRGLAAVDPGAGAALVLPCDQPWLDADTLDRLIAGWERTGAGIVLPVHQGRRSSPVLLDRSLFAELATLRGDRGARQLFPRHEDRIVEVEISSRRPLEDVDTVHDLAELERDGEDG